jgi:thioredoxin-dependent peroxiredoxin
MNLKPGDKAPEFIGKDQDGKEVRLSNYKGKKMVLYFYPNDDTPGCTAESCNLRDNYSALQKANYEVIGISSNDEASHRKFIKKYSLPFTLVADTDKKINEMYGVWQEKSTFGKKYMGTIRTTFLIDEKGIIKEIIEKVNTEEHTSQILK